MERFFLEHHVMKDRDPDELQLVDSDSEASDEEEEITERVHSVHDPTGPWQQKAVGDDWGHARKKVGTANRDFRSQHTGPKGVLNDYKAHKRYQRQEHERNEQERQAVLLRVAKGAVAEAHDDSSDCECDGMLLSDAFLQEYHAMRMKEMRENAERRQRFGQLDYISPTEFVKLTNDAPADVTTVIHLYHPESYPCTLLNQHLQHIAKDLAHIKFAALIAKEADDSIRMRDVPVLLVYRGQQQQETIVGVSEELDGEFTYERIRALLQQHI
ncbi:hypothetical protein Poli38472_014808 [Pythium oligandrum]|uniref:Phosducin domain-containing protein n=1 Tax=Pythium oligandrum TaxID=41045 RepID=A0A8K1FMQ8_PYTOL|nr:hypothetical protein Poli38472_014808 [Pythium oligandrum]|eukprot:TMW63898.1 hypothetical protein Poli38472_014808 [Pythium oligandrum]